MDLSIVISKGEENDEGRIYTHSPVKDVIKFLQLLGCDRWDLYSKGSVYLKAEKDDLFIGFGPLQPQDRGISIRSCRPLFCEHLTVTLEAGAVVFERVLREV